MRVKKHPTHALRTKWLMIFLALPGLISYGVGYYIQEYMVNQTAVNICVIIYMLAMFAVLLTFILRAYICRCPTCHGWLTKQKKVDTEEETRHFVCTKCQTIWDSTIQLHV